MQDKPTYFISDLHLSAHNPSLQKLFLQFLQGPALSAKSLYILGDLFDAWVGNDIHTDFQSDIQSALKTLHKHHVALYFMAGNRDFLLDQNFLKAAHLQKLPDPTVISLQGIPSLLTHGDLLCTEDKAYQRYRMLAQNPITKWLFLKLPKRSREKISLKLRSKSKHYQKLQHESILDVTQAAVQRMMQKYQVQQLIHGHVHRPGVHDLQVNGKYAKRIVLGDWHTKGSVIVSTQTQISLAVFCPDKGIIPRS